MDISCAAHAKHECTHSCIVQNELGNLFRCLSSGQLHICDANCDQRLYNDRYSTICRVSKKLFPPFASDADMGIDQAPRKRRADGDSCDFGVDMLGVDCVVASSAKLLKAQQPMPSCSPMAS